MWNFVVDKVAPGQVSPAKLIPPIAPKKNIFIIIIMNQSINPSSGICTIGQMGKRLWPQYKGLIDT
jgi:hypothetical protein